MPKISNESKVGRCVLIVTRKELSDQLKSQIERGIQVVNMPVGKYPQQDIYGRSIKQVYDKEQEDAFHYERRKWKQYVEELLKQSFSISNNDYHKEFCEIGQSLIFIPGQDYIQDEREEITKKVTYLESLIERLPLIPSAVEGRNASESKPTPAKSKKVFIVHGHDNAFRTEIELLIKQLNYEPIVLFKQASGGKTIIEKLERETDNVAFAIILYNACDYGHDKDSTKENPRARQNVIFEHGYLCAKLGRNRVCALAEPGIEIPGDLAGVVYVPTTGPWQYMIAKEMKQSGLEIDMNLL